MCTPEEETKLKRERENVDMYLVDTISRFNKDAAAPVTVHFSA